MGNVLDPKPPQWQRKEILEDVREDRVLLLAAKLKAQIDAEVDSNLVLLAALRLVTKAIVGNYRSIVGLEATRELLRQASELCDMYELKGIVDDPEH